MFFGGFMTKWILSSAITGAMLVLCVAAPAHALSNRAWVSGHGTDAAGCGAPTDPCRSLQYVISNIIATGGEIDVLDPAGYGAVTIPFALSIVNDGVGTAGVQATSGQNAITINAGTSDNVTLRGLNIDGLSSGGVGINLNSGGSLTITNCVVRHFTATGINIIPSSGTSIVSISSTIASDNGTNGIQFAPTGTGVVTGVISQTTAANNAQSGVVVNNAGSGATATVIDSIAFNNAGNAGFGVNAAGATMRIGLSVATGNSIGLLIGTNATMSSYGDNKVDGNVMNDVSGTLSSLTDK
jgi:hypothetical protein